MLSRGGRVSSRMMSTRVVDWTAVGHLCDSESIDTFRNKTGLLEREIMASPKSTPAINWDFYTNSIENKAIVEKLKAQYESAELEDKVTPEQIREARYPYEDSNMYRAEIARVDNFVSEYKKSFDLFKESHTKFLEERKELPTMTMQEFFEKYPEFTKAIEYNFNNDYWYNDAYIQPPPGLNSDLSLDKEYLQEKYLGGAGKFAHPVEDASTSKSA